MNLVTGATGFVGSALVRRLVEAGEPVRILRRRSSRLDLLGDAASAVEHAVGDVTDIESLVQAMDGVETVFHVAAVVAFGRRARARLRAVNVEGTAHVVNAALDAGVGRLVHTSSIAALGRPASAASASATVLDESAAWTPSPFNTAYARSKRDAEREVLRGVAEGLDAVIVNPAVVWGPGRSGEGTTAVAERLAAGHIPLAPPGATSVVDVQDVVSGLVAARDRGQSGERYLLSAQTLEWTEILDTLADALGVEPPSRTAPGWLLALGGALGEAAAALTRTEPALTWETARAARARVGYYGSRAERELGVAYRPFRDTADRVAGSLPPRRRGAAVGGSSR